MSTDLRITAGGAPGPAQLAALAAAVTALVEDERRVPADPTPAAYRSRWRRAAMIETTEVAGRLKDDRSPWGAH